MSWNFAEPNSKAVLLTFESLIKKVGKMLSKFLHFESYIVQKRINQRIRKLKKGSGEIWRAFFLLTWIQSFIKLKKSCKNHFRLYGQKEQILDHYTHENVAQSLNCDFTCATVHHFKLLVIVFERQSVNVNKIGKRRKKQKKMGGKSLFFLFFLFQTPKKSQNA